MRQNTVEYSRGQLIRAEAVRLSNESRRLAELAGEPGMQSLERAARLGLESLKTDPEGMPVGINRRAEHYEELMREIDGARNLVRGPAGCPEREALLTLARCHQYAMTILGIMQQTARAERVSA